MIDLREPAQRQVGNTLRLPCAARALAEFADVPALREALAWARAEGLAPLVLGEGSNVVLPAQLERLVLRSLDTRTERLADTGQHVELRVGAGKNWHALVSECLGAQLYGLENLALIPGSVGAAPVQNIGAYGVELAEFVTRIHGVDMESGRERMLARDECDFSYRNSVFKAGLAESFVITAVDLRLSSVPQVNASYPALAQRLDQLGARPTPELVFEAVVGIRSERLPDPALEPNAGSFFKNPIVPRAEALSLQSENPGLPVFAWGAKQSKVSAAWMIDACGFKGIERDGVGVSARHALVLVHRGGGYAALLALAEDIVAAVKARFGCTLDIEPVVYTGE